MFLRHKFKIIFLGLLLLSSPFFVSADYSGQKVNFSVNSDYDVSGRSQLQATLRKITPKIYFYIDDNWWGSLTNEQQNKIDIALSALTSEFEYKIYPILTATFGSEPKPGIDKDEHITILIHPMIENAGGYFLEGDIYPKLQFTGSNEREMIYLNADQIDKTIAKSLLAHEFMHLITENQKNIIRKVSEETWLNEARSEYASTLVGYDLEYEGSNLQKRARNFLDRPYDSLTDWQGKPFDYGVVNLFVQYLTEQYGIEILIDSLQSSQVGIPSINEALQKRGFKEDFPQVFKDWTVAVFINDCNVSEKYCYKDKNLKDLRVIPTGNFLPLSGKSNLSSTYSALNWSGNWYKFVGGWGTLKIVFSGDAKNIFSIPYVTQDVAGNLQVGYLNLDENNNGEVLIPDFRSKTYSITIIPSVRTKISGFDDEEMPVSFSWTASVGGNNGENNGGSNEAKLIQQLLAQIAQLQAEIAKVQSQINAILGGNGQNYSCQGFSGDLYFGMMNSNEIRCLQEFLKSQGTEIYPEGLITGNFLDATRSAVIKFQEKYASEILAPLGLETGSGFVGLKTRLKINQLLGY